MEMKTVTSSQIHAVGYDPDTRRLHVQFHRYENKQRFPGPVYEYHGISPETHAALTGAESIGKHFGANIKNNADIKFNKVG